jgi:putative acetyltransferase
MDFVLRPATNDDQGAIQALIFGVLREYGLKPDPEGTDADLQNIGDYYSFKKGRFDVLVDSSGRIFGTVALAQVTATTCELRKMYLDRSVRGQGLGRRLLDHALAVARRMGFHRMELETASVLQEAVALYERYGFQTFTHCHGACRCDLAYFLDLNHPPSRPSSPPVLPNPARYPATSRIALQEVVT